MHEALQLSKAELEDHGALTCRCSSDEATVVRMRAEPSLSQIRRTCSPNKSAGSTVRILVVPVERIELPTFGLQNRCSTAELNRLISSQGDVDKETRRQIPDSPGKGYRFAAYWINPWVRVSPRGTSLPWHKYGAAIAHVRLIRRLPTRDGGRCNVNSLTSSGSMTGAADRSWPTPRYHTPICHGLWHRCQNSAASLASCRPERHCTVGTGHQSSRKCRHTGRPMVGCDAGYRPTRHLCKAGI